MESNHIDPIKTASPFNVPLAIIIAGALIGGAVLYTGRDKETNKNLRASPTQNEAPLLEATKYAEVLDNIAPVTAEDHVLGDRNAPVILVEFSDTECPFCKRFHFDTMAKVMAEYGADGRVAWVYRHAPLDQLHDKARPEAEAAECAAKLGGAADSTNSPQAGSQTGNDNFWNYLNTLFERTPSNDGLDLTELNTIADELGLDMAAFRACRESGEFAEKVQAQLQDAIDSGLGSVPNTGTPYSIIIAKDGTKYLVSGAQPYENVRPLIEDALTKK